MRRWVFGALLIGLPATAVLAVAALALGRTEPGHNPLHIGCTHHNHGPKWHADHGRILGASRGAGTRDLPPTGDELRGRSLTAGRHGFQAGASALD
jgi:hypothetical protein